MIHYLLMTCSRLIRAIRRHLISFVLIAGLLALNVATVTLSTVYNTVRNAVWSLLENVPEIAQKKPKSVAELEAEAAKAKEAETKAKAEVDDAKKRLDTAEREKAELREAEGEAKSKAASAESKLKAAEAENTKLKTAEGKIKAEAETAKTKLATLEAEKADLIASERAAKVEADAVKAKLSGIETENVRLKGTLSELQSSVDVSRKDQKRVMDALDNLRNRITRSVQRSASGEVFQAVPFVGTAVVLGAMAYEANDACEQLRDLEELELALKGGASDRPTPDGLCLLSPSELFQRITGQNPAYQRCVEDRIRLSDLNPPSCSGYPSAVPEIEGGDLAYEAPPVFVPPDIE